MGEDERRSGDDGPVCPTPSADASSASWITGSTLPGQQLIHFGPSGLPAHARLRFVPDPSSPGQLESDAERPDDAPAEAEQLRRVLDVLARHTTTPDHAWFCLWDGWGLGADGRSLPRRQGDGASRGMPAQYVDPARPGVPPQSGPARPGVQPAQPDHPEPAPPLVQITHRAYHLFEGPLSAVGRWTADGPRPGAAEGFSPLPAFVWPADRAWCVARDVDLHWAGIGASQSAIDELLAQPGLDVVRADPTRQPPRYV